MRKNERPTSLSRPLVALVLATSFLCQVVAMIGENQTVDEGTHLAAGVSYWQRGDFRMNPEHPPFVKLIAALPLLILNPDLPDDESWQHGDEWTFGDRFLSENRFHPDTLLLLGRLPVLVLNLVLPLLVANWATARFGRRAGALALILTAFEPNLLAHGHYVTTDVPVTVAIVAATFAFLRYLRGPNGRRLLGSALLLGVALSTKYSAMILLPFFLFLFLVRRWQLRGGEKAARFLTAWGLAGLLVVSLFVVWASYGFATERPVDDPRIPALLEQGAAVRESGLDSIEDPLLRRIVRLSDPSTELGQAVERLLRGTPLPGYTYVRGFIQVLTHNRGGHASSLLGETRDDGWWYYFPTAFLVKSSLGFLSLLGLAIGIGIASLLRSSKAIGWSAIVRNGRIDDLALVAFPLAYFALSLMSNLNLGVRHLLPIVPFLIIGVSRLIAKPELFFIRKAVIGLAAAATLSSLAISPFYLTYFNEAVGGPHRGSAYLLDSNLDWGQDLKRLARFLRQHDETIVCMAYFGRADFRDYGIVGRRIPPNAVEQLRQGTLSCSVAVSATILFSSDDELFRELRSVAPSTRVGNSIYVFGLKPR